MPNLKEIKPHNSYFYVAQKFFKSFANKKKKKKEKKNVKKIVQFLEVYNLFTTNPISFTFVMSEHVYVEHKLCKFDKNPLSTVLPEIQNVEIRNFPLPVNKTLCILCLSWL